MIYSDTVYTVFFVSNDQVYCIVFSSDDFKVQQIESLIGEKNVDFQSTVPSELFSWFFWILNKQAGSIANRFNIANLTAFSEPFERETIRTQLLENHQIYPT